MSNTIYNKDINLLVSYKEWSRRGKISPIKKLGITFICLLIAFGTFIIGYLGYNKILNLEEEIQALEDYINYEPNQLSIKESEEVKTQVNNLSLEVKEIKEVITSRESFKKVDATIFNDIRNSIGVNDSIISIAYNREVNNLSVSLVTSGEVSSYDIIKRLKSKPQFKDVQYNMYQYNESKGVYQMSVNIYLADGKE